MLHVDPLLGLQDFHGRRLAFESGIAADVIRPVGAMLAKLYDVVRARGRHARRGEPAARSRRAARWWRSTPRSRVDDNALFRHPDVAEMRDLSAEDPQERMAQGARAHLREARREHRDPRQRRRARDVHARRGRAGRRQAGELPRRGRRLEGRGDHERGRGDPLGREGQGGAVQHLRRDHALRRGRARPDRGVRADQARRAVRGAARRHERRGGPRAARRGEPAERAHRGDDARRRREGRGAGRGRADGDPRRQRTRGCVVSGITGPRGHVPHAAQPRLRDQRRRRRDARQGRPGRGRHPRLQHVPRRGRGDRRQHGDGLRAAAVRRRLDPRGRGRRHRADHHDHRGHPRPRRAARLQPPARAAARGWSGPNCPGILSPGQGERGDHPGAVLQGGQRRARVALRHADLPDRQRAGPARLRQLVDRGHRRRPGARARASSTCSSCSRPTRRPS